MLILSVMNQGITLKLYLKRHLKFIALIRIRSQKKLVTIIWSALFSWRSLVVIYNDIHQVNWKLLSTHKNIVISLRQNHWTPVYNVFCTMYYSKYDHDCIILKDGWKDYRQDGFIINVHAVSTLQNINF